MVAKMGDLVVTLGPELVGLAVTPAAVIAWLMLLGSSHPYRNVACLAGVFLVDYGAICLAVLAVGRAADTSTGDPSTAHGWVGLIVGVLFLAGGVIRVRSSPTTGTSIAAASTTWRPPNHEAHKVSPGKGEVPRPIGVRHPAARPAYVRGQ
jgi:hypothetical protein